MRIVEFYSHLNGWEFLKVHKPMLWEEIVDAIDSVNAEECKTKISDEKTMKGAKLYAPVELNKQLKIEFVTRGWKEKRIPYWITNDPDLIRETMYLTPEEQKEKIENTGREPFFSYNQTDFVKDRVAVEVQLGKYSYVAFDMFVKHMAFFVGNEIDVGVEIVPMKEMNRSKESKHREMSTGVPYYERDLYNLVRQGRGVPAVPLVLVGIAP